MGARFVFHGLDQLKAELRTLPTDLAGEGNSIVLSEGEAAKAEIIAAYPAVTGNLRRGVSTTVTTSPFGTHVLVKSNARHAWLYEHGSQTRRYSGTDKLGRVFNNADRGVMPKAPPAFAFIPKMIRRRRQMYERLRELMTSKGLTVTGDAR